MKYIIYAGGSSGYQLYDGSSDFPKEYSAKIENLYANGRIVQEPLDRERDYRCLRFAPLGDRFLFSVIYKGYGGNGDARGNAATVNWLFDPFEADDFFAAGFRGRMVDLIAESDSIVIERGYEIPLKKVALKGAFMPTFNAQSALFSAAYYSTLRTENERIKVQTYVGCNCEEDILNHLCRLYDCLPPKMRRLVSFHAGASSAAETKDAVLVLMLDDILRPMNRKDDFYGAPMVDRMILSGDAFSGGVAVPEAAERYALIPDQKKEKLLNLLYNNDDAALFWDLVNTENYNDLFSATKLFSVLPEEIVLDCIRRRIFSVEHLEKVYRRREDFPHLPCVMEKLSELFREREVPKKEESPKEKEQEDVLVTHTRKSEEVQQEKDTRNKKEKKEKRDKKKKLPVFEKKAKQAPDPALSETAAPTSDKADASFNEKTKTPKVKLTKGFRLFLMLTFAVQILLLLLNLGLVAYWLGIGFIARLSGKIAAILFALLIAVIIVATVPLGFLLLSILDKLSEK
ncbi:MAG: hypothetical protein IKJ74_05845 [Clostridia bacterium]|nr:hypothetical protein [Clostridia bacterium]